MQPAGNRIGPKEPAYAMVAKELSGMPVWAFQGELDPAIHATNVRQLIAALRAAGAVVRYTEYPRAGHDVWDRAYREPELMPWLLAQHR